MTIKHGSWTLTVGPHRHLVLQTTQVSDLSAGLRRAEVRAAQVALADSLSGLSDRLYREAILSARDVHEPIRSWTIVPGRSHHMVQVTCDPDGQYHLQYGMHAVGRTVPDVLADTAAGLARAARAVDAGRHDQ